MEDYVFRICIGFGILIGIFFSYIGYRMNKRLDFLKKSRIEYMKTLSDKEYRKYQDFLNKDK